MALWQTLSKAILGSFEHECPCRRETETRQKQLYKLNEVQPEQGKASQSSCAQLCLKISNSVMCVPGIGFRWLMTPLWATCLFEETPVVDIMFHDVMSKMTRTWTMQMHFFGVKIWGFRSHPNHHANQIVASILISTFSTQAPRISLSLDIFHLSL